MPLVQTRGAASAQGFGEFAQAATAVNYIEDVFSTYLYTGTSATQTITNGIDLSTKGGLVWFKERSDTGEQQNHQLFDTTRGVNSRIFTSLTNAAQTIPDLLQSFNNNGFTLSSINSGALNYLASTYVSWTFRKQAKFFDIQTWTGSGANTTIAHSLGSVPGCIMVKRTDTAGAWAVYHRSLANTQYLVLNTTAAAATGATWWNSTTPTSSVFSLGTDATVNASGGTYIAYLFAHDAGGFGLTGTDNVISCGSYTATGAVQTITLGYEPQWILVKRTDSATGGSWGMFDTMRQMSVANASGNANLLVANATDAEALIVGFSPIATGFQTPAGNNFNLSGGTYIYIAIRRGPMAVPTTGTSVFTPIARAGTGANAEVTGAGFPVDLAWIKDRTSAYGNQDYDRLRGAGVRLGTYGDFGDQIDTTNGLTSFASMDGFSLGPDSTNIGVNRSGDNFINWCFRRAPGFFDVVCYSGSGSSPQVLTHNLTVTPEMMIVKFRDGSTNWYVYTAPVGNTKALYLGATATGAPVTSAVFWNNTSPTSTQFTVGSFPSGVGNYVTYLFATLAGVSKVGSYTGTGTTLQINCGFTAGARFVLIKRTDSTGDWYVWDSARGIIAGNDPYLLLNSTAAEVTGTDYVDTYSAGFEISSTAPAAINASAGTYIFLAIA